MNEKISRALAVLPDRPGVYLMRDDKGKIIYVGKAVVLKNRVRSYFRNLAAHTPKVKAMVAKIDDFETIVKFFEFNYISDKNKTKSYGVIAQDLEKVGLKNLVIEDADGYKSVDYNALLILEIQRLRNEIDILKSKIS